MTPKSGQGTSLRCRPRSSECRGQAGPDQCCRDQLCASSSSSTATGCRQPCPSYLEIRAMEGGLAKNAETCATASPRRLPASKLADQRLRVSRTWRAMGVQDVPAGAQRCPRRSAKFGRGSTRRPEPETRRKPRTPGIRRDFGPRAAQLDGMQKRLDTLANPDGSWRLGSSPRPLAGSRTGAAVETIFRPRFQAASRSAGSDRRAAAAARWASRSSQTDQPPKADPVRKVRFRRLSPARRVEADTS